MADERKDARQCVRVSSRRGHQRLAEVGWNQFQAKGADGLDEYFVRHLAFHLVESQHWDRIEHLLTDLGFYEVKNTHGLVYQLADDLQHAHNCLPQERTGCRLLRLLWRGLRREIEFIARHCQDYPQALFQSMWNYCWWYDCPGAERFFESLDYSVKYTDVKLHVLLERWRREKELREGSFVWFQSMRPPRKQWIRR